MKILVIGLALLVQQGMSDQSTELISQASNEFSNNLYREVLSQSGNQLICPISIHVALGLVHQGAGGKTAQELANALKLNGDNANIKEGYKAILTGLQDNVLKIVTKLYPQVGYQLNNDYINIAKEYFLSDIENLNYSDPNQAAGTINKYVEDHTNNKIHDLIDASSISDATRLIIVNAVHFNGLWETPFEQTYDDFFRVTPKDKVPAKMMSQTNYFEYKEDAALGAKVLKMNYKDNYSMIFVLPNAEDGLSVVENKLVNTGLQSLLNGLQKTKVEVTIPKFRIEKTMDLKNDLQKLGIQEVFSNSADLHNIANGDNLYVSKIVQKTFINVHENGTEAAAATGTFIETLSATGSDDVVFFAKWPFTFYLINNKMPTVSLFRGRLSMPDAPEISEQDRIYLAQNNHNLEEILKQNRRPQLTPNNNNNDNIGQTYNSQNNRNPDNRGGIFNNYEPQQFGTDSTDNFNYHIYRTSTYPSPNSTPRQGMFNNNQWYYHATPQIQNYNPNSQIRRQFQNYANSK